MLRYLSALAVLLSFFAAGVPALAQETEDKPFKRQVAVEWKDEFRRTSTAEKILTAVYLSGSVALNLSLSEFEEPNWIGPIGPDTAFYNALSRETVESREAVEGVSDILVLMNGAFPAGEVVYTWLVRGSPDAALEMFWITAHAQSLALFATNVTKFTVRRQRPGDGDCFDNDADCNEKNSLSFFSGHSSTAFAAAGVTCAHEQYLPLYTEESQWINMLPCMGLTLNAFFVATLRMMANRHYFTDVMTGAIVGGGIGYLLPTIFHYTSVEAEEHGVSLQLVPESNGERSMLKVIGSW